MEIDCGVCVLRPPRDEDAAYLTELANDREVWLNLRDRFPHPYRLEDAKTFIEFAGKQDPPSSLWIVVDGRAVGGIGIHPGHDIERVNAELGYWIGRPYWGRGITTAAVRGITKYAFERFELTRVFAVPFKRNPASIRVLEKAGYVREGLMRQSAIKDGVIEDQYLYAYYADRLPAP